MRKFAALILSFFALFYFCGCDNASATKPVCDNITYDAVVQYYGNEYTLKVEIDAVGTAKYSVVSPSSLKDFSIVFSGGGVTAYYKGLTYEPKLDSLPYGGLMQSLYMMNENARKQAVQRDNDRFHSASPQTARFRH